MTDDPRSEMDKVSNDLLAEIYDKSVRDLVTELQQKAMQQVFEGLDALAAEALGVTVEEMNSLSDDDFNSMIIRAGIKGYTIEVADKLPNTLVFTAKLNFIGNRAP